MNKKYECGIILDLLPLYIEGMVSPETEEVIQQHFSECETCKKAYEEMIQDMCIYGQLLMMPEMIRLSATDGALLTENTEAFSKLGFLIDEFGSGQFAVRQMPDDIIDLSIEDTVIEILELIKKNKNPEDILDKAFFMIACKGAVKANRPMSMKEMEALVKQVMENDRIRTCPHGRPLLISFSKKWIEKEFKRIV